MFTSIGTLAIKHVIDWGEVADALLKHHVVDYLPFDEGEAEPKSWDSNN
jgi:hypothetical protein